MFQLGHILSGLGCMDNPLPPGSCDKAFNLGSPNTLNIDRRNADIANIKNGDFTHNVKKQILFEFLCDFESFLFFGQCSSGFSAILPF